MTHFFKARLARQLASSRETHRRYGFTAASLAFAASLLLGAAPLSAQQLQGGVQQNEGAPGAGDVFNSQSPAFNSQGPGESFNSQNNFVDPQRCAADKARLAKTTNLPAGWGPPQLVSSATVTRYPSGYWAYYQNYACRPGVALVYRNLNYGKEPPPGQSGYYKMKTETYAPPYVPPVKGGVNVCNDPNAWRIPECKQQATVTPPSSGNKGIYRDRNPSPSQTNGQPDDLTMLRAMDDCLRKGSPDHVSYDNLASYYRTPRFQASAPNAPPVGYAAGTVYYNPAKLGNLLAQGHAYQRADLLASALVEHVFAQRKAAYPNIVRPQNALVVERDAVIGFLNWCVYKKKLTPETFNEDPHDPRLEFIALIPGVYEIPEESKFNSGWGGFLPYSVMMISGFERGGAFRPPGLQEILYQNYDRLDLGPTGGVYPPGGGGLLVPE